MNRYIIYLLLVLTIVSCKEDLISKVDTNNAEAVELTGAEAYIAGNSSTRAAALDAYNYVGRSTFINDDQMVLTTIKRTASPINGFHYTGIVYKHEIEDGQTSGGWNRDPDEGYAHDEHGALLTTHPERIYWSDSHNGHTYIGYSKPQGAFDWTVKEATYGGSGTVGIPVYYGSLGDPTAPGIIDYKNDADEEPVSDNNPSAPSDKSYKSGNEKIKSDDILLTYDNDKHAETGGSVAKLYFHHGLAQVRVIVNIQGFSASSTAADSWSVVSGMTLKDMLTLYRWRQQSNAAEALDGTYDVSNVTAIYGSGVTYDQKKDVHLWIPRPEGTGAGVGKQFTFYGLAVPTTMAAESLNLEFTVKYQDPMDPWIDAQKTEPKMVDHTYRAQMSSSIVFRAGYCTTINISLNHNNEQMTVGAEYMDWQLVETPDQGELKKNNTFLTSIARKTGTDRDAEGVTIVGDPLATEDDATWLYKSGNGTILDIDGNDGTIDHPYAISTAEQLLSFAYEVSNGRTFEGQYVKLCTDLVLQPSIDILHDAEGFYTLDSNGARTPSTGIVWPGIGEADKPFNGNFLGSSCYINNLYGKDLFTYLGPNAIVEHIFISKTLGITGKGSVAEVNEGVICGLNVEGDIKVVDPTADYCGSITGINKGVLLACSHIGDTEGYGTVGALVGKNDGVLAVCYCVGDAKSLSPSGRAYAGVGEFTPRSIAYCCYFNKDKFTGQDYPNLTDPGTIGHVAFPLSTAEMQSNRFVNLQYEIDPNTNMPISGNIIDDGTEHTDIFYSHFSLNGGLRRSVEYFFYVFEHTPDIQDEIYLHAPGQPLGQENQDNQVHLKKTIAQWFWQHFDYTTEGALRYEFRFAPATYPKLY